MASPPQFATYLYLNYFNCIWEVKQSTVLEFHFIHNPNTYKAQIGQINVQAIVST